MSSLYCQHAAGDEAARFGGGCQLADLRKAMRFQSGNFYAYLSFLGFDPLHHALATHAQILASKAQFELDGTGAKRLAGAQAKASRSEGKQSLFARGRWTEKRSLQILARHPRIS